MEELVQGQHEENKKKRIGTWLWETVCGELLDGKYMDLR
jgi:hypothetical protein